MGDLQENNVLKKFKLEILPRLPSFFVSGKRCVSYKLSQTVSFVLVVHRESEHKANSVHIALSWLISVNVRLFLEAWPDRAILC